MSEKRIVMLDGTSGLVPAEERVSAGLRDVLREAGDEVETFAVRDERIAHCIGCFGCWLETPGLCRSADVGRDIARALVHADTVVLVTPVTFGGYSSILKRPVDRFVQVLLPFFKTFGDEVHHPLRYGRFPRLVAVGIQPSPDPAEAALFRALVGRNALNFHAPSHAAGVLTGSESEAELRDRLASLLGKCDPTPSWASIDALTPEPLAPPDAERPVDGQQALILVGSPKTKKPSTSGVLGRHLLARLEERGWRGEVMTITAAIRTEAWRAKMLAAVDAADLLVLAFPLYIDALPALLTRALEVIRDHRHGRAAARPQRLAALVNSGFPEERQNRVALAMSARFAAAAGFSWAGGLAMGAGEALSSGVPLTERVPRGTRPPVDHVAAALDRAAAELAEGRPLSPATAALVARIPIPFFPFPVWRRFFAFSGGQRWRREAATHGVGRAGLFARPFLSDEPRTATKG